MTDDQQQQADLDEPHNLSRVWMPQIEEKQDWKRWCELAEQAGPVVEGRDG